MYIVICQFLKKKNIKCSLVFNTYLLPHFLHSLVSVHIPNLDSELRVVSFAQSSAIHIILIIELYLLLTLT